MPAMSPALTQIAEQIRAAAADGRALRLCGGGTKDFHGGPLEGEPLHLQALRGIVSHEPSELVVTVRAGTPLAELEALLQAHGQCLPFEPPQFGTGGTVGGMVAAGIAGPARASVGSVRDYVLGASLINGRGELLTFGGQVMKNVAGYDVSRVLVGAWGTLGAITELSLKVLPVPPAEATLAFECTQAGALRLLNAWGGQPLPLNASAWLAGPDGSVGRLHLRLRGAVAAVQAACRQLGGETVPQDTAGPFWAALRDQRHEAFAPAQAGGLALWRASVPQTAPALAAEGASALLVEWHGAQRWYAVPEGGVAALADAARQAGGWAAAFCPAAGRRAEPAPLPPALQAIHQRLKAAFDPAGIFNRGRLVAGL
ncbi:glycolate oxidase subunit GlcE [uncultured Pseudacidovorax sp.]|uniref:glycolate oxidase subunit GlcE n=1 Tax=uncultured Pseudacidovorax sp. TaxID=679313 RepID=UPI0025D3427A|nr:glycolate oxidase subunit GlcE [uncultured Pseudacidovorax sp.]